MKVTLNSLWGSLTGAMIFGTFVVAGVGVALMCFAGAISMCCVVHQIEREEELEGELWSKKTSEGVR